MAVVAIACLVGLVAVTVALMADEALARRAGAPGSDPLPVPADVARIRFPLTFPGYDPVTVETALETLNGAYADLLAVAPPAVVEHARRRAAERTGADPDEDLEVAAVPPPPIPSGSARPARPTRPARGDREALRAEAALASVAPGPG